MHLPRVRQILVFLPSGGFDLIFPNLSWHLFITVIKIFIYFIDLIQKQPTINNPSGIAKLSLVTEAERVQFNRLGAF